MSRLIAGLGLLGAAVLGKKKLVTNGYAPAGGYMDRMVDAYLTAALWSSTDDDDEPLDKNYGISDIAPEAVRQARADVKRFIERAGVLIADISPDSVGHDFWLTRNYHGAGFWDRGYGPKGDELTKISHGFGEKDAYVGDDGKVYFG
jgi:hypothetical protein